MATSAASPDLTADLEPHRRELTAYCYRMLGSAFEAEDAVQETMVRAWRAADTLSARAALRSWLYRIASNVCFDMLRGPQRRARPMDLGPSSTADSVLGPALVESTWIQPVPDAWVVGGGTDQADPAGLAASRETLRLAFVAALQHLPPRQRAVLILREVLRFSAAEVAELLDTTTASVNSALQRARATLDALDLDETGAVSFDDEEQQELLARYVDCFERYDVEALVALLHEDATFQMPPFALWLRGPDEVARWMLGTGAGCRGSRLLTTRANGCAAVGIYKPSPSGGHDPFNVAVLEVADGRITGIHHFLGPEHFGLFGLPPRLEP